MATALLTPTNAFGSHLVAIGSGYDVTCVNCNPTGFAATAVTFDGVDEFVNNGSLRIGETATSVAGGEWVEIRLDQVDGGALAANLGTAWSVQVSSLQFVEAVQSVQASGNVYLYFTLDDVPQPMTLPSFGGRIATHPTDATVPQVYFPPGNLVTLLPLDLTQGFGMGSDPFQFLLNQLGVPVGANGARLGRFIEQVNPFLISPLASPGSAIVDRSSTTADIASIFDHDRNSSQPLAFSVATGGRISGKAGTGFYSQSREENGAVLAFSGEFADIYPPGTSHDCYTNDLAFPTPYRLYGNYSQNPNILCQDGHAGVDYPTTFGTPIVAAASGLIVFRGCACGFTNAICSPACAGPGTSLGNYVAIQHFNGFITYYGHLSSFGVLDVNDWVFAGEVVGYSGDSGDGGGHLHFEVGSADSYVVDPYGYGGSGKLWLPDCDDSLDNDGDGLLDFPDDPECYSAEDTSEMTDCQDGFDNDLDGQADYPNDPDCLGPQDVSEVPEPSVLAGLLVGSALLGLLGRARSASQPCRQLVPRLRQLTEFISPSPLR